MPALGSSTLYRAVQHSPLASSDASSHSPRLLLPLLTAHVGISRSLFFDLAQLCSVEGKLASPLRVLLADLRNRLF
ncbi:hypothetical protein V2J09_018703 [Rumex salicifolius]